MDPIKLFDAEIRLMEIVWEKGPVTAKAVTLLAAGRIGWNKNTTYTVLKKLVEKGAIRRDEPDFLCTPLITREQVGTEETKRLIDRLYDGSSGAFLASFLKKEKLSAGELKELKDIIDRSFGGEG